MHKTTFMAAEMIEDKKVVALPKEGLPQGKMPLQLFVQPSRENAAFIDPERAMGYINDAADRAVEIQNQLNPFPAQDVAEALPSVDAFEQTLNGICEYAKRNKENFALMLLDLDGLDYVNCYMSCDMENELLNVVMLGIKTCLGSEAILCRNADSPFAVIVPGTKTQKEYREIAQKIVGLFLKPFDVQACEINIAVNIGMSIFPKDAQEANTLRKKAKIALLRAKKEGKNVYKFYSSELDVHSYKEFVLRNDLHRALENGELKIYYQPVVCLKNNNLLGAEALLRWDHSDWGMVAPAEFIPIAEQMGLIINIGKWTLQEICRCYREWLSKGLPPIMIGINFSGSQFLDDEFADSIAKIIEQYNLDPRFLVIEISERGLMKNPQKIVANINKLQEMGIQIALDDFGKWFSTGFSSLSHLNPVDINYLKIDCSFAKNVATDKTLAVIVKSVINMANELNLKMIAEGIESGEQLLYLKNYNCYAGQGSLFSEPLEPEQFEFLLKNKRCEPKLSADIQSPVIPENQRRFFRVKFYQPLAADMTILEIRGCQVDVGNTKVLIKDMSAGGLCFISDIKLPIGKFFTLQFTTHLLEQEIKVVGKLVWRKNAEHNLFQYGVEFIIDEQERTDLVKILNQVQIKMNKSLLFAEGSFVSMSPAAFFSRLKKKDRAAGNHNPLTDHVS